MVLRMAIKRICICLALLGLAWTCSCTRARVEAGGSDVFDPYYRAWNTVLLTHVTSQGVDYASLAASPQPLDQALAEMESVTAETFNGWPRADRLAFLINAHNAHAMARIVRHYPVTSLRETSPWLPARSCCDIHLLGQRWSLASLANEIMGERYQDSRAIFLLNWAEQGCSPLPPVAVTGRNYAYLADRQTRLCLADTNRQQYDIHRRIIRLTPIVKTSRKDLERDYTTLWGFLERFLPEVTAKQIHNIRPRIRYLSFDHTLNQWPDPALQEALPATDAAARQAETLKALEQTDEALDILAHMEAAPATPEPVKPPEPAAK